MPFIDEGTLERIAAAARQTHAAMEGAGETTIRRTADVLEVGGVAGVLSWADARYGAGGQMSLLAIPVDLWVAMLGLASSWFGFAGRYGRDAEMIGSGALAAYLSRLGTSFGAAQKAAVVTTAGLGGPEITGGQGGVEITGAIASMFGMGSPAHVGGDGKSYVVTEMQRAA
jgi:hypothetical protein